jgi:hypothetical protein
MIACLPSYQPLCLLVRPPGRSSCKTSSQWDLLAMVQATRPNVATTEFPTYSPACPPGRSSCKSSSHWDLLAAAARVPGFSLGFVRAERSPFDWHSDGTQDRIR